MEAMRDGDPRVRLESLRSFAKQKGETAGVATALIACLRDDDIEGRVRLCARPSGGRATQMSTRHKRSGPTTAASGDRDVRRLALKPWRPSPPTRGAEPASARRAG